MKKLLIGILAIFTAVALVACDGNNGKEQSNNNQTSENEVVTKPLTNEEMYGNVVNDYKEAIASYDFENAEPEEIALAKHPTINPTLVTHIARYADEGVEVTFKYYDIDKNGVDELIVGASEGFGAIYSYDKEKNVPVAIFFQETMERGALEIYDTGVILSQGAGGAALHYYEFGEISSTGTEFKSLEKIEEEYVEDGIDPVYRNADTKKTLEYKSIDEVYTKYIGDANKIN